MGATIALVGQIASGKGVISDMFIRRGYTHFSYGDEIRKEVDLRGLQQERNNRSDTAEGLRKGFGNEELVRRLAQTIDMHREQGFDERVVIDGLRHPDEVRWLREHYENLLVIGVIAPFDVRLQRFLRRGRDLDLLTPDDFHHYDKRDRGIGEPLFGNHADASVLMADIIIRNDGTIEELDGKLQQVLLKLDIEGINQETEGVSYGTESL